MSPRGGAPARRRDRSALPTLVLVLSACGYTAGFDLPSRGVRTVAVEVAGNETFRQRLEIPLTAEIHRALPLYAGVTLAAHEQADAILVVDIEAVQGRSLVQGNQLHPVLEGALDYTVRAVLRDRRTGDVLAERRIFDRAEFRAPVGETEESAVAEASRDLARKIALALEADF